MTKAYRYARFSHSTQAEGMSLERQADVATEWAARNGISLNDAFVDAGVSASRGKNLAKGAFSRFRQAVAAGDIPSGSYLLVESVSRFSRLGPDDMRPVLRELVEAGISVVFFDPSVTVTADNWDSMEVGMVLTIMSYIAKAYTDQLRAYKTKSWEKTKKEMREGRVATVMLPYWLKCDKSADGTRGAIEPHALYAPIVERIFREYVGGRGMPEIARRLNDDSVPCPARVGSKDTAAKFWRHTIVGRVLSNRAVLGVFQPHKEIKTRITLKSGIAGALKRKRAKDGEPIPDYYPAVISPELFAQAEAVRLSNRAHAGAKYAQGVHGEVKHILARLAVCPVCGSTMTRTNKGNGYGPKYVCSKAFAGKAGACQRVYVPVAAVERAVCQGANALIRGAPGEDKDLNAARAALSLELEQTRAKAEKLGNEVLAAALDLDDSAPAVSGAILKAHATLEARTLELTAKLEALDAKAHAASTNVIRQRLERMELALADYELLGEKHVAQTSAALFETFARVIIDYRDGTLHCHWRHGPPPSVLACREIKT